MITLQQNHQFKNLEYSDNHIKAIQAYIAHIGTNRYSEISFLDTFMNSF